MAYDCHTSFHALTSPDIHNFHTMRHLLVIELFSYISFCLLPYMATDSPKFEHIDGDT